MNIRERNHGDDLALVDIWLRSVRATHAFLTEKDIQALYPQVLNVRLPPCGSGSARTRPARSPASSA